ncbi:BrnT family toxin [soil metagenome]
MFDWDDANIDHIARHGLEPKDVEEALLDSESVPMPAYNYGSEKRRGLVGATNGGRILSVVYTERSGKTRPITAREASKSEKRRYRR